MDQARFETMNDQLASAGAPTEPRNGLDPDLLSQTLSALGLCGQGLQEPLRADPPRAPGVYAYRSRPMLPKGCRCYLH